METFWPDHRTVLKYCTREIEVLGPYFEFNVDDGVKKGIWGVAIGTKYKIREDIQWRIDRCMNAMEACWDLVSILRDGIGNGNKSWKDDEIDDACGLGCL